MGWRFAVQRKLNRTKKTRRRNSGGGGAATAAPYLDGEEQQLFGVKTIASLPYRKIWAIYGVRNAMLI